MAKKAIDTERFRHHLRPLCDVERAALAASIKADGCRDPLVVGVLDGLLYLVDGFNRKAICDELGVSYQTVEHPFATEEDVLCWIEENAKGRRNQTRTERNYYIGLRYLRERENKGGDRKSEKIKGKKVAFDSTAEKIAAEERCSHQHVKNCGNLAAHLNEAAACGMDFLKWPILTERMKYSKSMLEALIYRGAGGCQEEVEELLEKADGKAVSPRQVMEAIGEAPAQRQQTGELKRDPLAKFGDAIRGVVTIAIDAEISQLESLVTSAEDFAAQLRSILNNKKKN